MKIISGSRSWPRVDEEDFWSKLDLNDELDQPHQVQSWSLIGQHNNDLWLVNHIRQHKNDSAKLTHKLSDCVHPRLMTTGINKLMNELMLII